MVRFVSKQPQRTVNKSPCTSERIKAVKSYFITLGSLTHSYLSYFKNFIYLKSRVRETEKEGELEKSSVWQIILQRVAMAEDGPD